MRALVPALLLLFCGCRRGLIFDCPPEMTPQEMLQKATLVFVGVIRTQQFVSWPFFPVVTPTPERDSARYWRILRREVQIETLLRGTEPRSTIGVYEVFWTGGASGDWNSTREGERDLFLVRKESGQYHVVRDWSRSIFPVTSGPHTQLPLDDSHPFWERIALMNWWVQPNDERARITYPYFIYNDLGHALSRWRVVKLERGLARHPSRRVRIPACRELLMLGAWGQDECWDMLSDSDRSLLSDGGYRCCSAAEIAASLRKRQDVGGPMWWEFPDRESRRLLTAINNAKLRKEFCSFWEQEYPGDQDNGCPPDQPPPATIVTALGDVPLIGPWPR